MDYKIVLKLLEKLPKEKFHFCITIRSNSENCDWVIYNKENLSWEEFISEDNIALLDSKYNSITQLEEFIYKNIK